MTHIYKRVAELVLKHIAGEISEEEIIELNNIRLHSGLNPTIFDELLDVHRLAADLKQLNITNGKTLPPETGAVYSLTPHKRSLLKYGRIAAVIIPLLLLQYNRTDHSWRYKNSIHVMAETMQEAPTTATNNHHLTFEKRDLQYILRQLSNDPELEVIYAKGMDSVKYSGSIPQSTPYDEFAQHLLKCNGYNSTVKGKKIIVHS